MARAGSAGRRRAPGRIRTPDQELRRLLLCPLSYGGVGGPISERVKGIEPSSPAWKAGALPLSYTRERPGEDSGGTGRFRREELPGGAWLAPGRCASTGHHEADGPAAGAAERAPKQAQPRGPPNPTRYAEARLGCHMTVGLAGFEPATSCSQSRRAAKLRHSPSPAIVPRVSRRTHPVPWRHEDSARARRPDRGLAAAAPLGARRAGPGAPPPRVELRRDHGRAPGAEGHAGRLVPRHPADSRTGRGDPAPHGIQAGRAAGHAAQAPSRGGADTRAGL